MTVTSSPREGCATAPALLMRSITASISASVAELLMTIIIFSAYLFWSSKKGTGGKERRSARWAFLEVACPLCGQPAERLRKSPGTGGIGVALARHAGVREG